MQDSQSAPRPSRRRFLGASGAAGALILAGSSGNAGVPGASALRPVPEGERVVPAGESLDLLPPPGATNEPLVRYRRPPGKETLVRLRLG